jgi:hypothetical protein
MIVVDVSSHKPIILIENYTRYLFFKRILNTYGVVEYLLLVNSYTIQAILNKRHGENSVVLSRLNYLGDTINSLESSLYDKNIRNFSSNFLSLSEDLISRYHEFWLFNGNGYLSNVLSREAKGFFNLYYFEVGNVKGKVQIGLDGVNSRNRILINPTKYTVRSISTDPDSIFENDELTLIAPYDLRVIESLGMYLESKILQKSVIVKSLKWSLKKFFYKRISPVIISGYQENLLPDDCWMYLGQVRFDSQLRINGEFIDPISQLNNIKSRADSIGVQLCFRFHPREYDLFTVIRILKWCKKNSIRIVSGGDLSEVASSGKVKAFVTFNSTSGVQLMSKGIPVIVLDENCYYKNWNIGLIERYFSELLLRVGEKR